MLNLLVGLGNPGPEYAATRHNVGVWFLEAVAKHYGVAWRQENKFSGKVGQIQLNHSTCWLLQPTTFMNHSGQSVAAFTHFYKLAPESVLVAHDELSFPAGVIRFKEGGGHGGHNGLRDIIACLNSMEFKRLRIGIDHPGDRNKVTDYVLSKPNHSDHVLIEQAIGHALSALPDLLLGNFQSAFQYLHNI